MNPLTVQDISEITLTAPSTIHRWIQNKRLCVQKVSGKYICPSDTFAQFLSQNPRVLTNVLCNELTKYTKVKRDLLDEVFKTDFLLNGNLIDSLFCQGRYSVRWFMDGRLKGEITEQGEYVTKLSDFLSFLATDVSRIGKMYNAISDDSFNDIRNLILNSISDSFYQISRIHKLFGISYSAFYLLLKKSNIEFEKSTSLATVSVNSIAIFMHKYPKYFANLLNATPRIAPYTQMKNDFITEYKRRYGEYDKRIVVHDGIRWVPVKRTKKKNS